MFGPCEAMSLAIDGVIKGMRKAKGDFDDVIEMQRVHSRLLLLFHG